MLEIPFASLEAMLDFYKQHFGSVIMAYRHIGDDEERRAQLDHELEGWAAAMNAGRGGGPVAYHLEYTLSTATRTG